MEDLSLEGTSPPAFICIVAETCGWMAYKEYKWKSGPADLAELITDVQWT